VTGVASDDDRLDPTRALHHPEDAVDALEQRVFGGAGHADDTGDAAPGTGPEDTRSAGREQDSAAGAEFALDLEPDEQGEAEAAAYNPD